MIVGIPREIQVGEKRVASTPNTAKRLQKLGFKVGIETGAGLEAHFSDSEYEAVGVEIYPNAAAVWENSDIVLKVQPPQIDEIQKIKSSSHLVSFLWPGRNKDLLEALCGKETTALAIDCVPRISRAQKLDALSSMANIAGYRCIIEAASLFGSFFTGQITAAGKVPPAKVLVIGAGVAGLSAVGTARGLWCNC